MPTGGWCDLCRVRAKPSHWGTASHANKAWHKDHPKARRLPKWHRRAAEQYSMASVVRVRPYRRSRPADGSARVVKVRRYFRGRRGAY